MAPANRHTPTQKEFIVKKLAAFQPPRAIVTAFRAVYRDTACDENDILATDPETTLVAPELLSLFLSERERVLLDPKSAPYADKKARLIALSNHAKFYAGNNQFPEMRSVLRHIAEETGDLSVGGKPAGKAAAAAQVDAGRKITEIVETIIDPVAPAAT